MEGGREAELDGMLLGFHGNPGHCWYTQLQLNDRGTEEISDAKQPCEVNKSLEKTLTWQVYPRIPLAQT